MEKPNSAEDAAHKAKAMVGVESETTTETVKRAVNETAEKALEAGHRIAEASSDLVETIEDDAEPPESLVEAKEVVKAKIQAKEERMAESLEDINEAVAETG